MKKLEMVRGGVELLVGTGVSIIVGSALALVKPTNLGAIKKIAVSAGAFAISMMTVDKVTEHIDGVWDDTEDQIRNLFTSKPDEETENRGEA